MSVIRKTCPWIAAWLLYCLLVPSACTNIQNLIGNQQPITSAMDRRIRDLSYPEDSEMGIINDIEDRLFLEPIEKIVTEPPNVNEITEEEKPTRLIPVCPSGCKNGKCHRQNECICDIGYSASMNNTTGHSECVSLCEEKCIGGMCIGLNTCACDPGYVLSENRRTCNALCIAVGGGGPEGCGEYATCFAPNMCKCHEGYRNNRNGSLPVCLPITSCNETTHKKCSCNTDHSRKDTPKEDDDDDGDDEDDDDDDDDGGSSEMEIGFEIVAALVGSICGGICRKCWRCRCCSKKKEEPRISIV